jgi:hypothetical protein
MAQGGIVWPPNEDGSEYLLFQEYDPHSMSERFAMTERRRDGSKGCCVSVEVKDLIYMDKMDADEMRKRIIDDLRRQLDEARHKETMEKRAAQQKAEIEKIMSGGPQTGDKAVERVKITGVKITGKRIDEVPTISEEVIKNIMEIQAHAVKDRKMYEQQWSGGKQKAQEEDEEYVRTVQRVHGELEDLATLAEGNEEIAALVASLRKDIVSLVEYWK